jgi:hypothetical protein
MTDEITRACETCEHEQKSAVDNPCRNCLPSPRLPAWEPAEVEQTPAARIAELEAEVERLRGLIDAMLYHINNSTDCKHGYGFTYDFCPFVEKPVQPDVKSMPELDPALDLEEFDEWSNE